MRATSDAQWGTTQHGGLPPLEQVRDRVWVFAVPLPGGQPRLGYTLTYVLVDDDERLHVVDPGWDSQTNWDIVEHALDSVVPHGEVASIIVTHLHLDHLALAPRLSRSTGAPVVLHEAEAAALPQPVDHFWTELEEWGVPADRRSQLERDRPGAHSVPAPGSTLLLRGAVDHLRPPGVDIEVLHTPGHTSGHVCLRLPDQKLLLTGDHVLPAIRPGIGLGGPSATNPVADYLRSLELVAAYDDHEVLPGHNYRFTGLAERVAELAERHRTRTREVTEVLRSTPTASVYETAARLTWSSGWTRLGGYHLLSALHQTSLYLDLVRRS